MNVPFLKTTSLSTAKHVGIAVVLVAALAATGAHGQGFDEPRNPRWLSDDIVLAQHAEDCGCADDEAFDDDDEDFSDVDEDFDQEMEDDFAEDFDEDLDDGYGEGFGDDSGMAAASGEGFTAEQYQRLNERLDHVTDRALDVRLKALDVQIQGGYDYYGPAQ